MKKTFSKYERMIVIFSLCFSLLIMISAFKMDYSLTAPGYNNNVNNFIEIDSLNESSGSFHTTSVISLDGVTYLQYLIGNIEPKVSITPFPEYYDNLEVSDFKVMYYLMKDESLYTSLIVALSNSGNQIDYESYLTIYLTWNYLDPYTLRIGDKILDIKLEDESIELSEVVCGDTVVFTVLRGEKEFDFIVSKNQVSDSVCSIGISVSYFTEILSTDVEYKLIDTLTSGSSGGLMQTIYIYDRLTEFDYTHGLKVAGTGTINVDGTVGAIGGIKQKIYTSDYNDIDIFFAPFAGGNYDDAVEAFNTIDSDMIIVGVDTFSDAIDYLQNYQGGEDND